LSWFQEIVVPLTMVVLIGLGVWLALPKVSKPYVELQKKQPLWWGLLGGVVYVSLLTSVLIATSMSRPGESSIPGVSSDAVAWQLLVSAMIPVGFVMQVNWATWQRVLAMVVLIPVSLLWYVFPQHWAANVSAATAAVMSIVMLSAYMAWLQLRLVLCVVLAEFGYDVINTLVTGLMEKSVNATVTKSQPLPTLLYFVNPFDATDASILGVGDVVSAGLLVMTTGVLVARRYGRPAFIYAALAGCVVGFLACDWVLNITHAAQPAMMYLTPSILAAVGLTAWYYRLPLKQLMRFQGSQLLEPAKVRV